MKLLLVGDSHGEHHFLRQAAKHARTLGITTIVQLGDFGLWPDERRCGKWLRETDRILAANDVERLVWIDGNHDWHDRLDQYRDLGDRDHDGFIICDPARRIRYADRGHVWTWDGLRFGALGGAVSVDQQYRTFGLSWWKQEAPTQDDLDRLVDNAGPDGLDVLLTHDSPIFPPGATSMPGLSVHVEADCDRTRRLIASAVEQCSPEFVFHGHWHHHYVATMPDGTTVTGLADNGTLPRNFTPGQESLSMLAIDTGDLSFGPR